MSWSQALIWAQTGGPFVSERFTATTTELVTHLTRGNRRIAVRLTRNVVLIQASTHLSTEQAFAHELGKLIPMESRYFVTENPDRDPIPEIQSKLYETDRLMAACRFQSNYAINKKVSATYAELISNLGGTPDRSRFRPTPTQAARIMAWELQ